MDYKVQQWNLIMVKNPIQNPTRHYTLGFWQEITVRALPLLASHSTVQQSFSSFVRPQMLQIRRQNMSLHGHHTGMTSAQKGHLLILDCFAGKRLTTWYSAITNAWDTLRKEALPAGLLLLTVVYTGAAQFGWAVVALVCTGGVACAVELPLAHLNPPLPTHS